MKRTAAKVAALFVAMVCGFYSPASPWLIGLMGSMWLLGCMHGIDAAEQLADEAKLDDV
jgi:disulfide bond formation protein DsbB